MNIFYIPFIVALSTSLPAAAQQIAISVKQIGASFLEAPPGREKNLVPFGGFGVQEKVETHAVAIFKDRLVADVPFWGNESKVSASAIMTDKTLVELGTADISSFRKVSDDRKKTLISISIGRLPDKPISGVRFSGIVKIQVAKGESHKTIKFDPKVGSRLDVGLGAVTVSAVDANSITLNGGEKLERIAAMKIIKSDGTAIVGQRGAYARRGETEGIIVQSQWSFSGPIGTGKIDIVAYDGLETVDVPINLIVAKPY